MEKERQPLSILWREEKKTMTLEGVPVLEYSLCWPELSEGGRGERRVTRYYQRMARVWRERWGKELYWRACLSLLEQRERSRPFQPWSARLEGEVTYQDDGLLSIKMDARETEGDGRPLRVCAGDMWHLPEGAPCPVSEFFPGQRRWRKRLLDQLARQGEARRGAADCFFDRDLAKKLGGILAPSRCCRTGQGLEFYAPQCLLAPAAEGIPVFQLELTGHELGEFSEKRKKRKKG